jgi:hypothetical protein
MARSDIPFGDVGVKGKVAVMGLFATLGILLGCDSKPAYEDTRHLENPPPKPPNCPDLPELKNITLKDGTIADVRIVQFRDTKLYFPTKWLDHFSDRGKNQNSRFSNRQYLQNFSPDIHFSECPGVVHNFVYESQFERPLGYPTIDFRTPMIEFGGQVLSDDFRGIGYTLNPDKNNQSAQFKINIYESIKLDKDIVILMIRRGLRKNILTYESQSVLDLTKWLMTPPAQRDNDQKFVLKIDKVIKL